MKGLVANPSGKTIELPIKSNLKEGFTILEYFIATHGGRKGKSDTALKTAEAGHLTRRLVDSVQDIIIKEYDCGSDQAHIVTKAESDRIGEKMENRIFGRVLAENLVHPKTGEVLAEKGQEIDRNIIKLVDELNIQEVKVRSVITCRTRGGICVACYGRDLGTNKTVEPGTAAGIIAAQSIGEPGTQLTMRTFHMGGIASEEGDITQGLTRVEELFEARAPKSPAVMSELDGIAEINTKGQQVEITVTTEEPIEKDYLLISDLEATVKKGDVVKEKEVIAKSTSSKSVLRAEFNAKIIEVNTNHLRLRSMEKISRTYKIPFGKIIKIQNKNRVKKGQALTSGHLNLRDLINLTDVYTAQKYIVSEVQSIYASQGQTINDKHIEIIARQMLSKVRVLDPGDTHYLPGEIVDILEVENSNAQMEKENKKIASIERLLLGLTRISLHTDSWLSAASFQETIRVLVEASTTNKIDILQGLKENVIIGKLIPAGATYRKKHPELFTGEENAANETAENETVKTYPVI
jgi:DNA-directed RNA polymerase subunit beta'